MTFRNLRSPSTRRRAFTLIELMVVIGIVAVMLAILTPALGPTSGRSLDSASRLFLADLESARLMAIAERTRTRILIPVGASSALGQDVALRSYIIASLDRTTNNWKQRSKLTRLPQSVAFDPNPLVTSTEEMSVLNDRRTDTTTLDTMTTPFIGPYIEFKANGGTSLNPTDKFEVVVLRDGIADASGTFTAKNVNLRSQITLDPLSGSAISK